MKQRYCRNWFPFVCGALIFSLYPAAAGAQNLIISEFMASNSSSLFDVNGDSSDWIEIHNPTPSAVNLNNYFLTDDFSNLIRWPLPDTSLAAGGYLLIFASGKDRRDPSGELHTNFQLNKDGEYLALTRWGSAAITPEHAYAPGFPPQTTDVSYGLILPLTERYFNIPTPGSANDASDAGRPVFSRPGGVFTDDFSLILATDLPLTEIRYTLDGSVPNQTSPLYTAPIPINSTTQARVQVFRSGMSPGPIVSETYVRLGADTQKFSSDLPIVLVENFGAGDFVADSLKSSYMAIFEPDASGRSGLMNAPDLDSRAGVKIRGRSTANRPKKAYAVETWDEANADKRIAPLGMPRESDWILYAPYNFDRALIRNAFIYTISNQAGRYASRVRFVEVFVNTSGGDLSYADYVGVYVFLEKIKRDDDRVDVEKLSPFDNIEPAITGGYILKNDSLDPGDTGFRTSREHPGPSDGTFTYYCFVEPKEDELSSQQRSWVINHFEELEDALYGSNFRDPLSGYNKYLDADSFIDHHWLNELTKNPDGLRLSAYMFKPRNGKIQAGPIWDFDRTMGCADDNRSANTDEWYTYTHYDWWGRMDQDIDYHQKRIDRWQELRKGPFRVAHMHAVLDAMADELTEAQARNFERWPAVAPRFGSWQGEINHLKQWLSDRVDWIDSQYIAAPLFSHTGGMVGSGFQLEMGSVTTIEHIIVPAGSNWKYLDTNTYPGADWIKPSPLFDDSSWEAGNAELGYGDGDETTIVDGGPTDARYITTYFRHTFEAPDPSTFDRLRLGIRRDDGAVVYLNERRLSPSNISATTINHNTFADSAVGGADETTFFDIPVDPSYLNAGSNILAVEIHQANLTSSDISFDLVLKGLRTGIRPEYPIYYTTNGADPRLPGGAIDTVNATAYTAAVPLNKSVEVKARVFIDGEWSGLTCATFAVDVLSESLAITEVMYHPPDAPTGDPDAEFIEIQNISPESVNLSLLRLAGEIDFVFPDILLPAGGFVVVVKDPVAFAKRYDTTGMTIAGAYGPRSLNNTGGELRLENPLGEPLIEFAYNDARGWPQSPDGGGHSLTPLTAVLDRATSGSLYYGGNWRASTFMGGSPGQADPLPPVGVLISEFAAHTDNQPVSESNDWIELHNPTADSIILNDYYLSDNLTTPNLWAIPNGTSIPAGGWISFDEVMDFHTTPPAGFGLNKAGERIVLSHLPGTAVDRIVDDVRFKGQEAGFTLGRYPNDGRYWHSMSPTRAQANAQPFEHIVISEIMYHPDDGTTGTEYIELFNPTAQPMNLWNAAGLYRFDGGVQYTFTSNITLPAHGVLLVVNFDPVLDAPMLATFTAKYGAIRAPLVGPYRGNLDNRGERIALERPQDPDTLFAPVSWVIVDEVIYFDQTPFVATADGLGPSLNRISPTVSGNDSSNWTAYPPTPGVIQSIVEPKPSRMMYWRVY